MPIELAAPGDSTSSITLDYSHSHYYLFLSNPSSNLPCPIIHSTPDHQPGLLAAASAARSPSPSPSSSSSLISCRGWLDGAGNHVTAGGRSIGTHLIMNDLTCTMSVRWCAQSHASVRVGRSRTCRAPRSVCLSGKPRAQRGQGPSDSRPHGLQAVKLAGFVRPAMLLWGGSRAIEHASLREFVFTESQHTARSGSYCHGFLANLFGR